MNREKWKDVKGYEGLYQVSSSGAIKSIKRPRAKERMLKVQNAKHGYQQVCLCKNGNKRFYLVHRLVADAFLPNLCNYPEINHKDLNKQNNNVSNLEWCSAQYNVDYSNSKRVHQYDKQGNFIRTWKSTKEIERQMNIRNGNISSCCHGRLKTAYGYVWKYDD